MSIHGMCWMSGFWCGQTRELPTCTYLLTWIITATMYGQTADKSHGNAETCHITLSFAVCWVMHAQLQCISILASIGVSHACIGTT